MTKRSLLLVDGDAKSLRVLEVSLRKAGFTVSTAESGKSALQLLGSMRPDLVISDTDMPGMDGYEFCREFKSHAEWKDVPFIFLTAHTEIKDKIRGLELGVDDYLTKPIYIKEILTRVRILLQKHDRARFEQKKDSNTRFSGQLSDMGVVDLIQTIEVSRKTGVIHFRADEKRQATMFFKDGQVIDAEAGHLQGEDAVYRLLTWSEGEFEALFRPVRRRPVIEMPSQSLLMEGMRRLDEWGRLQEQLPPLTEKFQVVYDELWDRLAELPDDINQILRLFDTRRTLQEIIDGADIGDLETVEVISKLYFEGIIVEVDQDKGLKSGSYPVEDLVLQARAASASAAAKAKAAPVATSARTSKELAAVERELQEATEQDAMASMEFDQKAVTKGGTEDDALSGLLEQAITDATLVTKPKGKTKSETKRSTNKGLAVAPLPPAAAVDSEDTAPATSLPASEFRRPKTKPMAKLTPKAELDAAARMATDQAGSITSPVANADIKARLADLEASSVTMPIEDSAAIAREADKLASERGADSSPPPDTGGRIHTIATGTVESPDHPEEVDVALEPEPGTPAPEASESSAGGREYEADLDDLGEEASIEGLDESPEKVAGASTSRSIPAIAVASAASSPSPDSSSKSSSKASAKVDAAAATSEHDSVDIPLPERPRMSASTTAEITPITGEDEEPPFQSPVVWYVLAAIAAGFLGFVAFKSMGDDSGDSTGPNAGLATDGTASKGVVAPPPVVPDASATALAPPPDAATTALAPPPDAAAVVVATPPDAGRVVVAAPPPDARKSPTPPELGNGDEPPSKADQIKALQKEARQAKRRGDRVEAISILDEALEIKRTSTSLFLKAELLLSLGDSASALAVAKELTRAAPKRAQGWRILGLTSYEAKDYAGARKAFSRYLELSPKARDADDVRSILESM